MSNTFHRDLIKGKKKKCTGIGTKSLQNTWTFFKELGLRNVPGRRPMNMMTRFSQGKINNTVGYLMNANMLLRAFGYESLDREPTKRPH